MQMCFGGTEEPCAFAELISIGSIGGEKNKAISKALAEVLQSHFKVPSNRFYIKVCLIGVPDGKALVFTAYDAHATIDGS
jgi:hypothetical protein